MITPSTPEDILKQIANIQHLETGKLCVLRQGPNGPYYNLQHWEDGKNVSRYVPADQLAAVQENLEAHAQFEALSEQCVRIISERTRAQRLAGVKKNGLSAIHPRPRSRNPTVDGTVCSPSARRRSGAAIGGAFAHLQIGQRTRRLPFAASC